MNAPLIVGFADLDGTAHDLVGGKGANLGRLTAAGFRVPPGFSVSTAAYRRFLTSADLERRIEQELDGVDHTDQECLERITAGIRELIVRADFPPELRSETESAYRALGQEVYVAVRSSGTAEDLAEASFAGMHDTLLDIRGADALCTAITACWASLWTARAASYRQRNGFAHCTAGIAVVVQLMVESEVSGVMFTANPISGATDETVIDASWGLGEAVVGGLVTPDQYVVKSGPLKIIEHRIESKDTRVVRDIGSGSGTLVEAVPALDRDRAALTDQQVVELARLGNAVSQYYGGWPQDIEWALAGRTLYLLQSRPVTGVHLSWDADVESWQTEADQDDVVWTRAMADEAWCGAVTPLMYSCRAYLWQRAHRLMSRQMELDDVGRMRQWKFHRGQIYFNCELHRRWTEDACPPLARPALIDKLPADWHDEVLAAPFNKLRYLRKYLSYQLSDRSQRVTHWHQDMHRYTTERFEGGRGRPATEVAQLSDTALVRYIEDTIEYEAEYYDKFFFPFWIYPRDTISLLAVLLAKWYDGAHPAALLELMGGVPRRTVTVTENLALWELAKEIRADPELLMAFRHHENGAFFDAVRDIPAGPGFLERYSRFRTESEHRGHADRDMYYPRRGDDLGVDYRALQTLLNAEDLVNPEEHEAAVNARRVEVETEVIANLKAKPLGSLKAAVFRYLNYHLQEFLVVRDDQRTFTDRTTYSTKKGFEEIGRRLVARGAIDTHRDIYFLARAELYDLLLGRDNNPKLLSAKIGARRKDFEEVDTRQRRPAMYLRRGREVDLDHAHDEGDGLQGVGTSRGTVTGTARVIKGVVDIGRLGHGDVLICNSTDPGWTPVFLVVGGVVAETGGMLAHFSCLSREYGLPSVQLPHALDRIPDGALIEVNGDTGRVTVLDTEPDAVAADEMAAAGT